MTFAEAIERIGAEIDLGNMTPFEISEFLDRQRITNALKRLNWNQVAAAEYLGIHRNTLCRRIKELGIKKPAEVVSIKRRGCGRPLTPIGEIAKLSGVPIKQVKTYGLDRDLTSLALAVRLNDIDRTANRNAENRGK